MMTREKEIEKAASEAIEGLNSLEGFDKTDMFNMFVKAARWADKNRSSLDLTDEELDDMALNFALEHYNVAYDVAIASFKKGFIEGLNF